MAKDNEEELLPEEEDVDEDFREAMVEELKAEEEVPVPPDDPPETEAPKGVTYIRQPNGKLVPYEAGMDNR